MKDIFVVNSGKTKNTLSVLSVITVISGPRTVLSLKIAGRMLLCDIAQAGIGYAGRFPSFMQGTHTSRFRSRFLKISILRFSHLFI